MATKKDFYVGQTVYVRRNNAPNLQSCTVIKVGRKNVHVDLWKCGLQINMDTLHNYQGYAADYRLYLADSMEV